MLVLSGHHHKIQQNQGPKYLFTHKFKKDIMGIFDSIRKFVKDTQDVSRTETKSDSRINKDAAVDKKQRIEEGTRKLIGEYDIKDIAIAGACCEICGKVFKTGILGRECPECVSKLPNQRDYSILARFCIDCLGGNSADPFSGSVTCPQCGARLENSVLSVYDEETIECMLTTIDTKLLKNKKVKWLRRTP